MDIEIIRQMLAAIEANGPMPDPRDDIDTASLITKFPELAPVTIEELAIPGPAGDVPARHYRPSGTPLTHLMWVHGGGFIGGSLDMPESHWVSLTLASRGIDVVAVDYRKAVNGVKFPAPSDDVLAAWQWVSARTTGPLHLGGASAGANLSAGITKRLRDSDEALPASLLLIYPLVHAELPPFGADLERALADVPESIQFGVEVITFLNANLAGEGSRDPYAFPGEGDVSGLPRVFIINSEKDDLRASGELFAEQLAAAGVDVRTEVELDAGHGHIDQPDSAAAQRTLDRMTSWLLGA